MRIFYIFLMVSELFFAASVVIVFLKNKYDSKRLLKTAVPIVAGLLFLRLFASDLTQRTAVADAVLMTMRTFLVDGDIHVWEFEECLVERLGFLGLGGSSAQAVYWSMLFTEAAFDIAAPVMTFSAVLELFSQFFPKLRLRRHKRRQRFVFSEVNDETVTLAESICSHFKGRERVMLIATDAYSKSDDENMSELVARLRRIGCICLKDDLAELDIHAKRKVTYILADTDRRANVSAAIRLVERLSDEPELLSHENSVYCFTGMEEAEELLKKKCLALREKHKGRSYRMPLVFPIKEYKHAVYQLLEDEPLYEPILGPDGKLKDRLNVVIFGSGKTGTEAFLAAYWCGQMLGVTLTVTVVSRDSTTGFRGRINRLNLDILDESHSLPGKPYVSGALIRLDLASACLEELFSRRIDPSDEDVVCFGDVRTSVADGDYFIVALGDDEMDVSTAYKIRSAVERAAVDGRRKDKGKAICAVSIYDPALAETAGWDREDSHIRIVPFCSLKKRFSYENVINDVFRGSAKGISRLYQSRSGKRSEETFGTKDGIFDNYKYWSTISRSVYEKYMLRSGGIRHDPEDGKEGVEELAAALRNEELCARLAWNEHRRWSAFVRTMGLVRRKGFKDPDISHIHPCLVEIPEGRHHRLPFRIVSADRYLEDRLRWSGEDGEVFDLSGHTERFRNDRELFEVGLEGGGALRAGRFCTLGPEEIKSPRYDSLDRAVFDFVYHQDTRVNDLPQGSGLDLSDEFMLSYLCAGDKNAADWFDTRLGPDYNSYELFSFKETDSGRRIWDIKRFYLDDSMREELMGLLGRSFDGERTGKPSYRSQTELIELVARRWYPDKAYQGDLMTREMVLSFLSGGGKLRADTLIANRAYPRTERDGILYPAKSTELPGDTERTVSLRGVKVFLRSFHIKDRVVIDPDITADRENGVPPMTEEAIREELGPYLNGTDLFFGK